MIIFFAVQTNFRKFRVTEPEKRASQDRGKLDIASRVIENLQQAQHIGDFSRLEIAGGSIAAYGNAGEPQRLDKVAFARKRTHQDNNVTVFDWSWFFCFFIR